MLKGLESDEVSERHAGTSSKEHSEHVGAYGIQAIAALRGQSTQLVRKVIDHLAFTPGAKAKPTVMWLCMAARLCVKKFREHRSQIRLERWFAQP